MSEAGVPPKRAQEILGHADVRTTLAIYTHAMKRRHDDSADKMAELAGLTAVGNNGETSGSVKHEESELSACFNGSPGWNRSARLCVDFINEFRAGRRAATGAPAGKLVLAIFRHKAPLARQKDDRPTPGCLAEMLPNLNRGAFYVSATTEKRARGRLRPSFW